MLLVGTLKRIKELRQIRRLRGGILNDAQSKVSFPYSGIKERDRLEDGSDQAILADYTCSALMAERGTEGWHPPRRTMKAQKYHLNLIYQREPQRDCLRQCVFQEIQPIPYSLNS